MHDRPFVRRAGSGRLSDGRRLRWTVAEGARGRRWRSATTDDDGHLDLALLVEVAPDGSFVKLEASAPAGLLTLHPEDGVLYGNRVHDRGVEDILLPYLDGAIVLTSGSPVGAAVAARSLAGRVAVGERATIECVAVGPDLDLRVEPVSAHRQADRVWGFGFRTGASVAWFELDEDGVPVLDEAASWPLEHDEHAPA